MDGDGYDGQHGHDGRVESVGSGMKEQSNSPEETEGWNYRETEVTEMKNRWQESEISEPSLSSVILGNLEANISFLRGLRFSVVPSLPALGYLSELSI